MSTISTDVTIDVDQFTANAIVTAASSALVRLGESLGSDNHPWHDSDPGDLMAIARDARHIARLTAVLDQLEWRSHRGRFHDEAPFPLTASEATLIELAGLLRDLADDASLAAKDVTAELAEKDRAMSTAMLRASRALSTTIGALEVTA